MRLYRGLSEVSPDDVDTTWLGNHWTTDPKVARLFATDGFDTGDERGTVVEALIHRRHVVPHGSSEWQQMSEYRPIYDDSHPEQEKTIRSGATVHLQKMTYVGRDEGSDEKTVEMPRGLRSRGRA